MSINLYHQCGHNSNWNRESFNDDGCGAGLILSPIHQSKNTIEKFDPELKQASLFDPQYYLPNSQKRKLKTYSFFPETISSGFDTKEFASLALESARKCVNFQIEQNFFKNYNSCAIFPDMVPDYMEQQEIYSVHPFLQALPENKTNKDIYLTLPISTAMLSHREYRTSLLNWVTSFQEINGVYLLVEDQRSTKQIHDASFLKDYMLTIFELTEAGLGVLVGHCNTEGILFSLIKDCDISFGAYENTRIFSLDKFVVSEDERRGPKPRMYIPGLFNWIQVSQVKEIRENFPSIWDDIYIPTPYGDSVLDAVAEPHFNFPALYKHHFIAFQEQIRVLEKVSVDDRYQYLRSNFRKADDVYSEIEAYPIDLDRHGRGDHILPWLESINWYKREIMN